MGVPLTRTLELFGYSCPWCKLVIVDAGMAPAVTVFELHVDGHLEAGDHLRSAAPRIPPPRAVPDIVERLRRDEL